MSLDKITIDTEYLEINQLLNVDSLKKTCTALNISKGVIYYFISDDELLAINKQVLQHDYYTDIITFDYTDDEDMECHEVMISWDRVKENAKEFKEPLYAELHRVCIHGLLHISGQNDSNEKEKKRMRKLENHYLSIYCST